MVGISVELKATTKTSFSNETLDITMYRERNVRHKR